MVTTSVSQGMKQIIIINDTLQMPRNQRAAQIARASIGAFFEAGKENKKAWIKEGRPKIVLNVLDKDDLQDLLIKAEKCKLPVCLIEDNAGQASPTNTIVCLGIGPVSEIQANQLVEILDYYRRIRESTLKTRMLED